MPDEIKRIDYYYASVPDKPGEGARILAALRGAGVNLLGVSAFPHGAGRSQLDLIPEDSVMCAKAAKTAGLKLSQEKRVLHPGRRPVGGGGRGPEPARRGEPQRHVGASLLRWLGPLRWNALGQND